MYHHTHSRFLCLSSPTAPPHPPGQDALFRQTRLQSASGEILAGGFGEPGDVDGPVAVARFNNPYDVAIGSGALLGRPLQDVVYVADRLNHKVPAPARPCRRPRPPFLMRLFSLITRTHTDTHTHTHKFNVTFLETTPA